MTLKNRIGIFDSGIGGLSVLKALIEQDDNLDFIYFADSAYTPYGDKTESEIIERCLSITQYLIDQKVDLIVVACNTATALAVNQIRKKYNLAVVAMEPGVKPAIQNSNTGNIGILATTRTLQSHRYIQLLERFTTEGNFTEQACPGLVELIEDLQVDSPQMRKLLRTYLEPMLEQSIDTFVLGCTHYPLIKDQIKKIIGTDKNLVDTSAAIARQVKRKLVEKNMPSTISIERKFLTTGEVDNLKKQLTFYDMEYTQIASVDI